MTPPREMPIPTLREALRYFVRLVLLIRPYWRRLFQGLALGLLVGVVGMVTPYLTKLFVDEVYPTRDVRLMHVLVIGVLVVSLATSAMGALRGYYSQVITARLSRTIRLLFFNHLQHLPVRFFEQHRVGEVMSRFGDMSNSLGAVSGVLQTVLVSGTYLLLVPPLLLALNWKLALLSMVSVPITATVSVISGRVSRRYFKRSAEVGAELNAFQLEVMSHIRAVKAMDAEAVVYRRAADQMEEGLRVQIKAATFGAAVGVGTSLVRLAGTAVFTWYAWTLIISGELSLGEFMAFSAYVGYLTGPVGQFAGLVAGFQRTAVTLGRAFEYLDEPPEQDPGLAYLPRAPIARRMRGEIELRGLSFGYDEGRRVLDGLTCTIPQGEVVAVVGSSGAGKSSLLRLLCRLCEAEPGTLLIDGVPISAWSLSDVRRQVGVVWQEFALMRGSVWDNLTFGLEPHQVDPERVREAARICRVDEIVRVLPAGYDTPVAEWGASLSGGQRQRMAIARALVPDAPVLLLDEATSQLDVQTEEGLLRDLLESRRGRTTVLVTHRMATATIADRICVLDAGRLAAVGTHRQLNESCEVYRAMVRSSSAHEEPRAYRSLALERR